MNCRTSKKRQYIVENYEVKPDAHVQLLAGQIIYSDAGAAIENDYYIFEATPKGTRKKYFIQCGMGAARDFLKLLDHKGLPLFNPLHNHGEARQNANVREGQQGFAQNDNNTWDPTAKQLYNAIMWLIIAWGGKPGPALSSEMNSAIKYKSCAPYDDRVKRINNIIKKDRRGRTLSQMIDEFRVNNDIRDDMCDFNLLTNIIENIIDENGDHLISYF